MTEQESLEYNKRCALFLGYKILSKPYKGAVTVQEGCYNPMFLHDRIEGESWYVYPEFHSDWNWIMEVVEAIEKLNYKFQLGWNITALISLVPNTPAKIALIESENRKEAVVKAINQFLIWYNNEQRT